MYVLYQAQFVKLAVTVMYYYKNDGYTVLDVIGVNISIVTSKFIIIILLVHNHQTYQNNINDRGNYKNKKLSCKES